MSPVIGKASNWLIFIGGCFFLLVLAASGIWEADIRSFRH